MAKPTIAELEKKISKQALRLENARNDVKRLIADANRSLTGLQIFLATAKPTDEDFQADYFNKVNDMRQGLNYDGALIVAGIDSAE